MLAIVDADEVFIHVMIAALVPVTAIDSRPSAYAELAYRVAALCGSVILSHRHVYPLETFVDGLFPSKKINKQRGSS